MIQHLSYWLFFVALVVVYWRLPVSWRPWFLALSCMGYLATVTPMTLAVMLALSVAFYVVYGLDLAVRTRKAAGWCLIFAALGYLGYHKYLPVLRETLEGTPSVAAVAIPLGISFFTFKLVHYGIERGRRTLPQHGFADYLSYLFLVPIFTAGPIERFDHFIKQRQDSWETSHLVEGLSRVSHGLIKKFVIGALILALIGRVTDGGGGAGLMAQLETISSFEAIAFVVLTYLYIYMDFSGYSDIAIGSSRLLGLKIMENFDRPVAAPNIGVLWKRWHMSLAGWCQSYVYMPVLGLTRNPYLSVFASFSVMGMWHGASLNWVAWGLYNAVGVSIYQTWLRISRRRKWKFMEQSPLRFLAVPATFMYFAGSFAFTATEHQGLYAGVRLLLKCLFITLPA